MMLFFKLLLVANLFVSSSRTNSSSQSNSNNTENSSLKSLSRERRLTLRSSSTNKSQNESRVSARITRSKTGCISETAVDSVEDGESEADDIHDSFKLKCLKLSREIKTFAMKQVGLKGTLKSFTYSDYKIRNWPILVPRSFNNWDEQALLDLKKALPSLVFVKKTKSRKSLTASEDSSYERLANRRQILDLFLESYRRQTRRKHDAKIMWAHYHLKGWPRNVKLRSDRWNCSEILAMYRNLDIIKFVPVSPGQERTITYADGGVETTKNRKRKFKAESDSESDNNNEVDSDNESDDDDKDDNESDSIDEDESVKDKMAEDIASSSSSASIDCNYITSASTSSAVLESDDLMDLGIIRDDDKEPCIFEQFYLDSLENQEDEEDGSDSSSDPAIQVSPYSEINDVEKFIEEELENYNPNLDNF